jgi:hypothetical protein
VLAVYDDELLVHPLARGVFGDLSSQPDGQRVPLVLDRFGCQESPQLAPEQWCGEAKPPVHFAWAPDSESLLFEAAGGGLWLGDAGARPSVPARSVATEMPAAPPGSRRQSYAFQPSEP